MSESPISGEESPRRGSRAIVIDVDSALSQETEIEMDEMTDLPNQVQRRISGAGDPHALKRRLSVVARDLIVPEDRQTSLTWKAVTCTIFENKKDEVGKRILNEVSGAVRPGEMCAVMGPSGSGKTTMLDFLADRKKNTSRQRLEGDVLVNGKPRGKTFRYYSAYVQQEDTLVGTLTVHETFLFSAALTMREKRADRHKFVEDIINILGLAHAKDVYIGNIFKKGISGGQKRRVSIGIEMLKNPTLMFLDEPTSGLDSESAFKIVEYLRKLADTGRTVVFTVHQPNSEIYAQFHKLMILARGKMVYNGMADQAVDYFNALGYPLPPFTNPADFFIRLINTDFEVAEEGGKVNDKRLDEFAVAYEKSDNKQRVLQEIDDIGRESAEKKALTSEAGEATYAASFLKQLFYLSKRRNTDNLRNPGVFWVRLAMFFMLCFMIGTIYWRMDHDHDRIQDRIGLLFYTAAFLVFMSIAVVPQFIEDRAVFVRERRNGYYSVAAHVLADSLMSIPGLLIISAISSVTVFFMAGLHGGAEGFFVFMFDLFMSLYVAEGMLAFIASLVPHYIIGMALGAAVYGFFMLTQGFFVLPDNIPGYWIWGFYIGFHQYSFRIFMHNEFSGNTFNSTTFPTGEDVLRYYDMDNVDVGENFGILISMAVIYRTLFFLGLYFFRTGRQ